MSQQSGLRQLRYQRARYDHRIGAMFAALRGEGVRIEAVMQQQRAATEQPRHHGEREAGERARGAAAEQASVRLDAALEQGGEAAGDQLGVIARHGNEPVGRDVERHHGDVSRGVAVAFDLWRQLAWGIPQQVVQRDHTVRQISAEAADMADRKDVGRDLHRHGAGIEAADPRCGDNGSGANLAERACHVGAPP